MRRPQAARSPAYAGLCSQCSTGTRGACDCVSLMPAEACTELGAHAKLPLHQSAAAYMLAPLFDRWPRLAGWLAAVVTVLLLVLGGENPVEILAAPHLPGDGFPPELLAAPETVAAAASEVQP